MNQLMLPLRREPKPLFWFEVVLKLTTEKGESMAQRFSIEARDEQNAIRRTRWHARHEMGYKRGGCSCLEVRRLDKEPEGGE